MGSKQSSLKTVDVSGFDQVRLARLVSLVLHPFVVSPASIVLILWLNTGNLLSAIGWAVLCAAFVVGPAVLYLRGKLKRRQYTDSDVSVQEHRNGFYIFGAICMVACFGTLLWLDAPLVLIAGFSAALAALVVAIIINRWWTKISIHTGAIVGVAAAAAFYSIPLALVLGAGALLISWARLVTGRHTAVQAIAAWAVAIISVVGVFGPVLLTA
jgi:uncharacterized membrane protein